jgi:hypothetical protein
MAKSVLNQALRGLQARAHGRSWICDYSKSDRNLVGEADRLIRNLSTHNVGLTCFGGDATQALPSHQNLDALGQTKYQMIQVRD